LNDEIRPAQQLFTWRRDAQPAQAGAKPDVIRHESKR